MKINIDEISQAIVSELRDYTNEVMEEIEVAEESITKQGVNELKNTSPKQHGDYAKSWRKTKDKDGTTVHNAKHYQLTHLLENGHAKVNGGFVSGIPHIAPVEEMMIEMYEKAAENAVKR